MYNNVFTSIFHEDAIPVPSAQDTKVNMNIEVSQKNIPKVKTLLNQETKQDIKNKNDAIKKQQEDLSKARLASAAATTESSFLSHINLI